ncbi:serine hydrolase domain-containing protein [Actinomadura kijaniata]
MRMSRFGTPGRLAFAATLVTVLVTAPLGGPAARAHLPGPTPAAAPAAERPATLDPGRLRATLEATRATGMYGLYSTVRAGGERWQGASGVADVRTRRPVEPGLTHRVGDVTAMFTAVAVLRQAERGRLRLDDPVAAHLPDLFPDDRGQRVTVRMLLDHTSGVADHRHATFPSLTERSPASLDAGRRRRADVDRLIDRGVSAPPTGVPGERWSYSTTNTLVAGRVLEKVTGERAEDVITRDVIRRAGLRHTAFPRQPRLRSPHARAYEGLYGGLTPPRDYSDYDMSYAWTAGALASTMDDLTRFQRALFQGRLLDARSLAEMRRTVPATDGTTAFRYGLGLAAFDLSCGTFWGHDGAVFGAGTRVLSGPDGERQLAVGWNLTGYQRLDGAGRPVVHPIDNALRAHVEQALCGGPDTLPAGPGSQPMPLVHLDPAR